MTGTVQNKETFLNHIANNLKRDRKHSGVIKPVWTHRPQFEVFKDATQDELVAVLKKQCENIHTDVIEVAKDELHAAVETVIGNYGGGTVVTWDDPRYQAYDLILNPEHVHVWNPDLGEENIRIATNANVGITFSDLTLAESATVVLFSGNGKGRSVSLLPATYIAIIPKSTIVPRMTQAAQLIDEKVKNGEAIASCVNFISGPSNSADIEMNLIVGVHGPIKATYIIVNDG